MLRILLYIILFLFAFYYLLPLFVMITTSLKSLEEIKTGSLVSLPRDITIDAWSVAWSKAFDHATLQASIVISRGSETRLPVLISSKLLSEVVIITKSGRR